MSKIKVRWTNIQGFKSTNAVNTSKVLVSLTLKFIFLSSVACKHIGRI